MITDRNSDILKYLNNNGGLVSVAEIASCKDLSGMSRRDINKVLMSLEKNGKIFRKIKDGKYYYTVNEKLADPPMGYHTFLSKVSEGINQFNMLNDLNDDDDNGEEVDLDEVISKLDDMIAMLSEISGDDENDDLDTGITKKNVDKIFDLTYKKKRTYTDPLNTYTFEISDGFEYTEHPDDDHAFAVWYPDDFDGSLESGLVTICPSDVFQNMIGGFAEKQFESCKNSHGKHGVTNILARAIASAASFHLYGIYTSVASMLGNIEIIMFPADRKICGSGYRMMRDDACTYFFWLLLDGKLVAFSVDIAVGNSISDVPMDKVFDGLCTLLEHIHPVTSENAVRETDDNRYMSKAMTYKLAEEWVDEQLEKMNQMAMAHNLITGAIMDNANNLGEDEESMRRAVVNYIDMWFQYENKVCEKFAEQVNNVLCKQHSLSCRREVMAKLCEHAEEFIDTPAMQNCNINNGEYIISVKSDKYEAIKKSAESIIGKYKTIIDSNRKEAEHKKQQEKQEEKESLNDIADRKRLEKYRSVRKFFSYTPKTLAQIMDENREELKELGIMSPQGLLGVIRPGLESGEIIREKDKKTTVFRLF